MNAEEQLRAQLRAEGFPDLADELQFVNGFAVVNRAIPAADIARVSAILAGFLRPVPPYEPFSERDTT